MTFNRLRWIHRSAATLVGLFIILAASPSTGQDGANFFAGRQIRIIVGTPPGGGYDTYARMVARHLGAQIPGRPSFVVENMPGAGGIKAANYLQGMAVADGTVFATFNNSIPFYQVVGLPGVQYKAESFSYIGSLTQTASVSAVWHGTGVKTIDDARRIEVIMGATGAAGTKVGYAALLNNTLGTRFKIVTGYDGSNSVMLAIERSEVEGDASNPYSSWKTNRPEWIKDRKIIPIVQIGLKKDPELPDVPLLTELAQNDEQRQMFAFVAAPVAIQQPFAGPPGVPADRLAILRRGFDRMAKDTAFHADLEKARLDLDPLAGEEVTRIVRSIIDTPPAIVQKVQAAMVAKDAHKAPGSGSGGGGGEKE